MKTFCKTICAAMTLALGLCFTACDDANEYEDTNTNNPTWGSGEVSHPETLEGTVYVRGNGIKRNAMGQEVQGYVDSLKFVSANEVAVVMNEGNQPEGNTTGTWVDESNTPDEPYYEYAYSAITGSFDVMRLVKDDKGNLTKKTIMKGVAVSGSQEGITVLHYGDTPAQTYLVKQ